MTLFEQIQSDMYAAMKGGDKSKANTLRTTLAKLKDKKIERVVFNEITKKAVTHLSLIHI